MKNPECFPFDTKMVKNVISYFSTPKAGNLLIHDID